MATDGEQVAICPACGYPTLVGVLCAVCIPVSAAAGVDPTIETAGDTRGVTPAA